MPLPAHLDLKEALALRFPSSSPGAFAGALGVFGPPPLALGWPELDEALPDGGLPRGVVELTAPHALGGSTSVALAAVRAAHAKGAREWCAWIDPEGTLHAPAVVRAGVDLTRLLVVRPPRADIARFAVKVAASGAFEVVVVDVDPVLFARAACSGQSRPSGLPASEKRRRPGEVFVRKLALVAEETGTTILLLSDASQPHAAPWPVALRLELTRSSPEEIALRVGKERRGRIGLKKTVPLATRPTTLSRTA
jgi:hypothetical protein